MIVRAVGHPGKGLPKLSYGLKELSAALSVSVAYLRLEVRRGNLKSIHLGGRVLVSTDALADWLSAKEASQP
jgi:hypothetical protein